MNLPVPRSSTAKSSARMHAAVRLGVPKRRDLSSHIGAVAERRAETRSAIDTDAVDGRVRTLSATPLTHDATRRNDDAQHQQPARQAVPHRWRVVAAMAVAFAICNLDKVNMSVAVIPMAAEMGWSATDRGLVSSAFFWGYTLTQIPAGYIATKVGGAKVLLFGVTLWSLGTLVAPTLAHQSLLALCVSRLIVGLGEGFAPSAATKLMAGSVPEGERSRAVSVVWGGLDVGSVAGFLLCGPLIHSYGWPVVFELFGVLGLAWAALWPLTRPEQVDGVMLLERARLGDGPEAPGSKHGDEDEGGAPPVPYGKFLSSPAVWAIISAHFCFNYGYYTLLAWVPSYFELALGVSVEQSSLLALVPYVAMVCMTPVVGPVADSLIARGWTVTSVRKLCQTVSFVGPALCMMGLAVCTPTSGGPASAEATTQVLALMTVAFALSAWARAGLYCNHQDLSPKYASALVGLSNTAGAVPGVVGVAAAGALLDATGSWALAVFAPTALVQLVGTAVYAKYASSERRDDWL